MGLMDSAVLRMSNKGFYALCFICLGNICRSPALAAVFEAMAEKRGAADLFFVDSMALTTYYIGRPADERMRLVASKHGVKIEHIAQLFRPADFQRFDAIFGATDECLEILNDLAVSDEERKKVFMATAFSKKFKNQEIPDPYYDGEEAFERVMQMSFDACEGILDHFLQSTNH